MAELPIETYLPGLSIDCVIFGFHEMELKVLLLNMKNQEEWALPGGFIQKDQDVDIEANRILENRTGLKNIFLQQFHLFGDLTRNKAGHAKKLVETKIISDDLRPWFEQRFLSIGYYALVEYSKVQVPTPDFTSDSCEWCSLNNLPKLIMDHQQIIDRAHQVLKKELNYQPIGLNLLPQQFTMSEIQTLYETVLGKTLDRRNFRRKILSYDILVATNKQRKGGTHRAPMLYEFDEEKYTQAIQEGLKSLF
ncbi:MAG: NUDIX hydrolase [Saprospiraceae bacterium]|nr:NUDIX hydrolase [Saprospiraceae bacterium]